MKITQEQIEALKKNEKPFGLMSAELQEAAKKMGRYDFQCYMHHGQWLKCHIEVGEENEWSNGHTYRLRPDYEQEPSIVECEITLLGDELAYSNPGRNLKVYIDTAPRDPDFIGFKFEDGFVRMDATAFDLKEVFTGVEFCDDCVKMEKLNDFEVLHATHVLFRSTK